MAAEAVAEVARRSSARLNSLAKKFGGDKQGGSKGHGFALIYGMALSEVQNTTRRMCELGVFWGASTRMWNEYFPNAEVIGVDVFRMPGYPGYEGPAQALLANYRAGKLPPRIRLEVGDQSNATDLRRLADDFAASGPAFDLIVDDASHRHAHQQQTWARFFPLLRPGGLYIIEDIHTFASNTFGKPAHSFGTTRHVIDRLINGSGLTSAHMDAAQQQYIEEWTEGAMAVVPPNQHPHRSQTALIYKRMAPVAPARAPLKDVLWRTHFAEADVVRDPAMPWAVRVARWDVASWGRTS